MFNPPVALNLSMPDEAELRRRIRGRNKEKRIRRALKRVRPKEADTRTVFADWMTSTENPRFALVIANRMWKRAFGRGLIEPIDDIKEDTSAVAPELLEHLTQLMIELDFDLREFERVLFYTRHWRRAAAAPASVPGDIGDLRGPLLRRMSSEQAWDSLLTLVVPDIDGKLRPPLTPQAERIYKTYETLAGATDDEILEQTAKLVLRYSDPEKFRQQQRAARAKVQAENRRKKNGARKLYQAYGRARKTKDHAKMAEIAATTAGDGPQRARRARTARRSRSERHVTRVRPPVARTRRPPAPRTRTVGARVDRGVAHRPDRAAGACAAQRVPRTEGAQERRRDAHALPRHVARHTRQGQDAFVSVLGRMPTSSERGGWEVEVNRNGEEGLRDLVWTLVNSHEFLFIQ